MASPPCHVSLAAHKPLALIGDTLPLRPRLILHPGRGRLRSLRQKVAPQNGGVDGLSSALRQHRVILSLLGLEAELGLHER